MLEQRPGQGDNGNVMLTAFELLVYHDIKKPEWVYKR